jgi:hypothetical protein
MPDSPQIRTVPPRLIAADGRPVTGIFSAPIPDLNYRDFQPPGKRGRVSPWRIKRWQYLGAVSPEVIVGAAVVSLGYLGNAFFYLFDRTRRELIAAERMAPLGRGIEFGSNGIEGAVRFAAGRDRLTLTNDPAGGRRLSAEFGGARVEAEFADRREPLVCVTRVGYAGFNYTLKQAGLPAAGKVSARGREWTLDPERAFGVVDYTTGRLGRETFWNWASAGGRDEAGNLIGINLVLGVNESGFTENAVWIGDKLVKVDTVNFEYDDRDRLRPWRIQSADGRVDLRFEPEGERGQDLDLIVLASKFHQLFGRFRGELHDPQGTVHRVAELSGYTEEHYARW